MKIEFLVLADSAQVANGKLFILGGGWGVWRSPHFPVQIQLALALNTLISPTEIGSKFPLKITIKDDANIPILPELNAEVMAGKIDDLPKGTVQKVPLAVNMGLMIPRPGRYMVQASIGSSHVETIFDAIFVGQKTQISLAPDDPATAGERGN